MEEKGKGETEALKKILLSLKEVNLFVCRKKTVKAEARAGKGSKLPCFPEKKT